jgi:hypothetical protein
MASGHVNRTYRPNTWLHRPSLRRKVFPCQLGAVHTWLLLNPRASHLLMRATTTAVNTPMELSASQSF